MLVKCELALLVSFLSVFGWQTQAQDWTFDEEAKVKGGVPRVVTIYTASLDEKFGEIQVGVRVITSQYSYGQDRQLAEWLYYESGKPVEFTRCSYDKSGRLSSKMTKTANGLTTAKYSYGYQHVLQSRLRE